ncbi:MAG: alpha/beta hydrolase [Actinomycetota bacterium]
MSGASKAQARDLPPGMPEVEGIEHRFIDLDDFRVHVAEAGEGDPVLLLHGWPQHWYMWRQVIERLSPRFRLIAPDLRGFGWSEAPGQGYDPETFAEDQLTLLDALDIDRVRLIGHDWGGYVAFLLGLGAPERLERMIVLNCPHPWPRVRPRLLLQTWRSWYAVANSLPVLGRRVTQSSSMPKFMLRTGNVANPFPDGLDVYLDRFRDPDRAEVTVQLYRYYLRAFVQGLRGGAYRDAHLTVPTLLLFGADDLFVPSDLLEGGEEHADDMHIELVPGSGHFIANERPDLVARRALAFLS